MDDLTKRNFHALSEGLKSERTKNYNLAIKVSSLEQTVAQLQQEITQMRQQLISMVSVSVGTGATSL